MSVHRRGLSKTNRRLWANPPEYESHIDRDLFERFRKKNLMPTIEGNKVNRRNLASSAKDLKYAEDCNLIQDKKIRLHYQKFYKYPCIDEIASKYDLSSAEKSTIHRHYRLHTSTPSEAQQFLASCLKKSPPNERLVSAYFAQYALCGRVLTDCLVFLCKKLYVVDKLNTPAVQHLLKLYAIEIMEQNENCYSRYQDILVIFDEIINLSMQFSLDQNIDCAILRDKFVKKVHARICESNYSQELGYYFEKIRKEPLTINYDYIQIGKNDSKENDELRVTSSDIYYVGIHPMNLVKINKNKSKGSVLLKKYLGKDSQTYNRFAAMYSIGKNKKLTEVKSESPMYVMVILRTFIALFEPSEFIRIVTKSEIDISSKKGGSFFQTTLDFIKASLRKSNSSENSLNTESHPNNESVGIPLSPDNKTSNNNNEQHDTHEINVNELNRGQYQRLLKNLAKAHMIIKLNNLYIPCNHVKKDSFIYIETGKEIRTIKIGLSTSNILAGMYLSSKGCVFKASTDMKETSINKIINLLRFLSALCSNISEKQFDEIIAENEDRNLKALITNLEYESQISILKRMINSDNNNDVVNNYYHSLDYQVDTLDECCIDCNHEIDYKIDIINQKINLTRQTILKEEETQSKQAYSSYDEKKMWKYFFDLRISYLASIYYRHDSTLKALKNCKKLKPLHFGFK